MSPKNLVYSFFFFMKKRNCSCVCLKETEEEFKIQEIFFWFYIQKSFLFASCFCGCNVSTFVSKCFACKNDIDMVPGVNNTIKINDDIYWTSTSVKTEAIESVILNSISRLIKVLFNCIKNIQQNTDKIILTDTSNQVYTQKG